MNFLRMLTAFAAASLAGCGDTVNTDLDFRVIGVRGVVRDAAQAPVSGATVTLSAYRVSCTGFVDGDATTQTGPDGRFVTRLGGSPSPEPRCVRVQASKGALNGSTALSNVVFSVRTPKDTIDVSVVVN